MLSLAFDILEIVLISWYSLELAFVHIPPESNSIIILTSATKR